MATVSTTIELVDKITRQLNNIQGAVDNLQSSLSGISNEQSNLDKFSWKTFLSNAEEAGNKMAKIGRNMTLAISTPLSLLGRKMYNNSVEYESAFAGVEKTVTATEDEYATLYSDLLSISERTPTGFVEGANIMEMAGQLGVGKVNEFGEDISEQFRVATEDLSKFTETYIGLQESTNIAGEGGAADLARFLNVTEKTTANVDKIGGVIVGLGNNFATTEQEILAMATRMGATADLAGFSAPEILALSTALSSVGINAEAGGSAAGKLMKRMQLAAEVGGKAQQALDAVDLHFESGLEAQNWLDSLKSSDVSDIAYQMGMTKDALDDMVSSWLALDQFSSVMGLDQAGFLQSWDEGAAQSMLQFFQGLGNLDAETGNSVLAQLAEMDLTEIRLSNLVAAMAGNSDIFATALNEAYRQYNLDPTVNALAEEVAKRYDTQESQNQMLANKLDNTMADFGDNLVEALQPALDLVNQILDAFNQLSESDQTALIKTLGAIALLGPGLTITGKAISSIASGLELINKMKGAENVVTNTVNAGANAAGVGGAVNAGSFVAKAGLIAGTAYLFNKGAEYRQEYGAIGSVEAIANGTRQNQELQSAFVDFIQSQAAMEDAIMNMGAYSDQEQESIANWAQSASETFYAFDDAVNLMHLYSDWRDAQGLGNMDWVMPEGLPELFSQSMQDSGANVAQGLADGITGNEGAATDAATTMGQDAIDAANAGLGVNSPSIFMIQSGMDVANGLAQGITSGGSVAIAAISAVSNSVLNSARAILSIANSASVGRNVAVGIANGIRSGTGMAAAAARALANSVMSALRASLQVHSPSRLTYGVGEYTVEGLVNGILANRKAAGRAMEAVANTAEKAWNTAAWSDIALFAGLEHDKLLDDADDAIKISDSDIRNIRDLAEREVINHFTTAEVKVEFGGVTNNVNSNMDLDGIVDYLGDAVSERLEAVAEGVYS